jgi:hypothetical protein
MYPSGDAGMFMVSALTDKATTTNASSKPFVIVLICYLTWSPSF